MDLPCGLVCLRLSADKSTRGETEAGDDLVVHRSGNFDLLHECCSPPKALTKIIFSSGLLNFL